MRAADSVEIASRRAMAMPKAWPSVRSVLRIIQDDLELSSVTSKFVLTRDFAVDVEQHRKLSEGLVEKLANLSEFSLRSPAEISGIIELAYDEIVGISVLGPFWRDDSITEILVDGWDSITVERSGGLVRTPVAFMDLEHAQDVARRLALKVSDRALNPANPLVTAELPGARVTFAIDSVVKSQISVSMRKFPPLMRMDSLLGFGALSQEMRDFLDAAVAARANILVSGGTGTGKTTFINALSESIPDSERVITIEDAYELTLRNTHWVALQTKEAASSDDEVRVDLASLLTNTLRMRPDRVIVGEIREADAAAVMLQAANTGHDGTMTTIHANSADRALNFRLVGLVRTAAQMPAEVAASEVASAIDIVVQVVRERGRRFVQEIVVCDPELVDGARISPVKIFTGELDANGDCVFTRQHAVPARTQLGMKMRDAGDLVWVDTGR